MMAVYGHVQWRTPKDNVVSNKQVFNTYVNTDSVIGVEQDVVFKLAQTRNNTRPAQSLEIVQTASQTSGQAIRIVLLWVRIGIYRLFFS